MNPNTADIVAKLWREAKTLQGAGVSILHYVNELTYLLFLKMLEETGQTDLIPAEYRWIELARLEGGDQLRHYRKLLLDLGDATKVKNPLVLAIFTDAQTAISKPVDLKMLTTNIDKIDWFSAREDGLVVSMSSARDRKPAPRALMTSTMSSRSRSERARRSYFVTTMTSPSRS